MLRKVTLRRALENYMRYAERTQVYRQASLIRRMIVAVRGMLLKSRKDTYQCIFFERYR